MRCLEQVFIMIAMVGGYVSGLLGVDSFFALLAGHTLGSLLGIWGAFNMNNINRGDF